MSNQNKFKIHTNKKKYRSYKKKIINTIVQKLKLIIYQILLPKRKLMNFYNPIMTQIEKEHGEELVVFIFHHTVENIKLVMLL